MTLGINKIGKHYWDKIWQETDAHGSEVRILGLFLLLGTLGDFSGRSWKSFVTMWMNLKGVMLNEINQAENHKYCMISLTFESKKEKQQQIQYNQRLEWWLPGTGRWGNRGAIAQGNKQPVLRWINSKNLVYSMVIIVNKYSIIYLKVAEKVDLECSYYKKTKW